MDNSDSVLPVYTVNEDNVVIEDNVSNATDTNTEDVIDINIIDDQMCYKIWKDFKEQYRPFATSLIKLTDPSTYDYFANDVGESKKVLNLYNNPFSIKPLVLQV